MADDASLEGLCVFSQPLALPFFLSTTSYTRRQSVKQLFMHFRPSSRMLRNWYLLARRMGAAMLANGICTEAS